MNLGFPKGSETRLKAYALYTEVELSFPAIIRNNSFPCLSVVGFPYMHYLASDESSMKLLRPLNESDESWRQFAKSAFDWSLLLVFFLRRTTKQSKSGYWHRRRSTCSRRSQSRAALLKPFETWEKEGKWWLACCKHTTHSPKPR